jgi:two-component system sensor histidine kinase/response regulator
LHCKRYRSYRTILVMHQATAPLKPPSVLVVEDERIVARDIGRMLAEQGYEVAGYASSSREAIEKALSTRPDLVLMDIHLEGKGDGTEAAFEIRQQVGSSVVYLTAFSDPATLARAKRANPLGYVLKPFTAPDLTCALEIALHERRVAAATARRTGQPKIEIALPPDSTSVSPTELLTSDSTQSPEDARKLAEENRDLRTFGLALVHELHGPLSTLSAIADMMTADFSTALPAEGLDMLRRVRDTTQRVRRLTNDVHRLSSVEHQLIYDEQVDLGWLVERPLRELRQRDPARDVHTNIESGLFVRGDARLLQIALENLLRNAWKHTACRTRAHITIGRSKVGDVTAFYVQDDGIGFDGRLVGKLSNPFVRLHYVNEFEGSGLGLFIARRIIERHGGRMWARSETGYGATFFFTLPLPSSMDAS